MTTKGAKMAKLVVSGNTVVVVHKDSFLLVLTKAEAQDLAYQIKRDLPVQHMQPGHHLYCAVNEGSMECDC
jgi:hypothetical protein